MRKLIDKLTISILLSIYSFASLASVINFVPSGGTFSNIYSIYWDMTSSSIGITNSGSYVGGFELSDHGDFHINDAGSGMVTSTSGGTDGLSLSTGAIVSSASNFNGSSYAGTYSFGGTIVQSASPVTYGLKFLIGSNVHYGYVRFIEDVSTHSIVCWAYESVSGASITVADCTGLLASVSANLTPNAQAMRSVFNIQTSALNAGLSYDCTVFDKKGICLSTGGRYSTTNSPETATTSGLLIGSYRFDKNIRLGAWVDQNLSTNNTDGVKLGNSKPLLGVFGAWAERSDGLGYEVKVSAGYGDKDIEVTRTSTNQGSAKMSSRGIQSVSSYGIALDSNWIAAPYVGVKYLSVKRGAYTEGGADALTYNALRQETISAIAGVKLTGKIDPQTFTVFSAGIEQNLSHNVGKYSATSGDTAEFNSNVQKTRPVVSAGVYYDIDKIQRVGLNLIHRQEAFQTTTSTTALATYTVGF